MDLFMGSDLQVLITQAFSMAQSIYFKFKQKVMIGVNQLVSITVLLLALQNGRMDSEETPFLLLIFFN